MAINGTPARAGFSGTETLANAITATAVSNNLKVTGASMVRVELTISASATVTFKGRMDGGTLAARFAVNVATGVWATTATATGEYDVFVLGDDDFVADVTIVSGTVTAKARAIYGPPPLGILTDSSGNLKVTLNTALIASIDSITTYPFGHTYSAVAVADVQIKGSAGTLHTITISCNDAAPTAGSFIVYDSLTETGTVVFNHTFTTTPFAPFTVTLDYAMLTGIYFGFTTTGDVNVSCSFR